jgi:hypothetical protein
LASSLVEIRSLCFHSLTQFRQNGANLFVRYFRRHGTTCDALAGHKLSLNTAAFVPCTLGNGRAGKCSESALYFRIASKRRKMNASQVLRKHILIYNCNQHAKTECHFCVQYYEICQQVVLEKTAGVGRRRLNDLREAEGCKTYLSCRVLKMYSPVPIKILQQLCC